MHHQQRFFKIKYETFQSLVVMPGCTLEVWDKDSGLATAKSEEAKSPNAANLQDNKDRYKGNKLVITATSTPNWVQQIKDDFGKMNEDIGSYR